MSTSITHLKEIESITPAQEMMLTNAHSTMLIKAVAKFDSYQVRNLINMGVDPKIQDRYGNNLIFILLKEYYVARKNKQSDSEAKQLKETVFEILDFLLDLKVIDVNQPYGSEITKIEKERENETVRIAFKGYTPLMLICFIGDLELTKRLMNQAKVDKRSPLAENPLTYFNDSSRSRLFDLIIKDIKEFTPLLAAIAGRNIEIVKLLIERGADPTYITPDGWYPYRISYIEQIMNDCLDTEWLAYLFELGIVIDFDQEDYQIFTSNGIIKNINYIVNEYYISLQRKKTDKEFSLVAILTSLNTIIEQRISVNAILSIRDTALNTPLHIAILNHNQVAVVHLFTASDMLTIPERVKLLSAVNASGETVLDCLIKTQAEDPEFYNEVLEMLTAYATPLAQYMYSKFKEPRTDKLSILNKVPEDMISMVSKYLFQCPPASFARQNIKDPISETMLSWLRSQTNHYNRYMQDKWYEEGLYYSKKSDTESQKSAMICFHKASVTGHTKAMGWLALYHMRGILNKEGTPLPNVQLVDKILKKISANNELPIPYISYHIDKLKSDIKAIRDKEASKDKAKGVEALNSVIVSEKPAEVIFSIAKVEVKKKKESQELQTEIDTAISLEKGKTNEEILKDPKHFITINENNYENYILSCVNEMNHLACGPQRRNIPFNVAWKDKPYFITYSDQYPGAFNLVWFFYQFKIKHNTKDRILASIKLKYSEQLIRITENAIEFACPQEDDNFILSTDRSFTTFAELLEDFSSNHIYDYLSSFEDPNKFRHYSFVSAKELLDKDETINEYVMKIWEQKAMEYSNEIQQLKERIAVVSAPSTIDLQAIIEVSKEKKELQDLVAPKVQAHKICKKTEVVEMQYISHLFQHKCFRPTITRDILENFIESKDRSEILELMMHQFRPKNDDAWKQLPYIIWPVAPEIDVYMFSALYFKYKHSDIYNLHDLKPREHLSWLFWQKFIDFDMVHVPFKVVREGIKYCTIGENGIKINTNGEKSIDVMIKTLCENMGVHHERQGVQRHNSFANEYETVSYLSLLNSKETLLEYINQTLQSFNSLYKGTVGSLPANLVIVRETTLQDLLKKPIQKAESPTSVQPVQQTSQGTLSLSHLPLTFAQPPSSNTNAALSSTPSSTVYKGALLEEGEFNFKASDEAEKTNSPGKH